MTQTINLLFRRNAFYIICFLIFYLPKSICAQQFNTDNYLVMPHGTGTFVLTSGERNATLSSSFALIPRFEFFFQGNLFWEQRSENISQHFTISIYGKYSIWVNDKNSGGLSAFLGFGKSPGYFNQTQSLEAHTNYWTSISYTIPLFNNTISWDIMPGGIVDFEYADTDETEWGFTYSTRFNVYDIIPESAIVAEVYGTTGGVESKPEYKIGIRWEPNDYIVPAITYGNNFSNGSAAGFEIGVMIFTPPFLKKKFIKENSVN